MSEDPEWADVEIVYVTKRYEDGRPVMLHTLGEEGLLMPTLFDAQFVSSDRQLSAHLEVDVDNAGHAQCRAVSIRALPGKPSLTGDAIRLPLASMLEIAIQRAARRMVINEQGVPGLAAASSDEAKAASKIIRAAKPPSQRRPRVSDTVLQEAAEVYRANPSRPTKAVMEYFPVSEATAGRYVKKARDRGLLNPSLGQGKKGELDVEETNR